MGCFSYICKECGEPILSNSFTGQKVKLFLLENGIVKQWMEGEYDSYGRTFIDETQVESVKHSLRESHHWTIANRSNETDDEERENWHAVCDLNFSDNVADGIAAVHEKCYTGNVPKTQSEDDPDQGWGDEDDDLFGNCDEEMEIE